jgi:hypothetical protein
MSLRARSKIFGLCTGGDKADASLAAHAAAAASAKPAAASANGVASLATPRVVAGGVEANDKRAEAAEAAATAAANAEASALVAAGASQDAQAAAKQDASRAEAAAAKAEQVAKAQAAAQAAAIKSADAAAARRKLVTTKRVHVAAVCSAKAKRSALFYAVAEEEVAKLQKDLWQAKVDLGELWGLCKESRSAKFSEREAALEKAIGAAAKELEAKMPPSPVSGGAASVPAAAPPEAPSHGIGLARRRIGARAVAGGRAPRPKPQFRDGGISALCGQAQRRAHHHAGGQGLGRPSLEGAPRYVQPASARPSLGRGNSGGEGGGFERGNASDAAECAVVAEFAFVIKWRLLRLSIIHPEHNELSKVDAGEASLLMMSIN